MRRRSRLTAAVLAAILAPVPACAAGAADKPSWDQVTSIKDAAQRIAKLQRARGAAAALKFIDACYKTHGLASEYGESLEACIAQDYLQTQALVSVYERLPEQSLRDMGAPTPSAMTSALDKRMLAAFALYNIDSDYADNLKKLVDEHGLPIFLGIVFPDAGSAKVPSSKQRR